TDRARFEALWTPDFNSVDAFEQSVVPLREALNQSIGYPPPGDRPTDEATFTEIGRDDLGTYYRAMIPILPGVHSEGILIIPRQLDAPAPLVIAMHGGGGSPEVALFHGGANYHEMVRGGVRRGFVVYAPQHLFRAEDYPADVRNRIDQRLRLVGTTITAVEVAKITRAIDVLEQRPEVDSERIAMVGLSYGGFYALMAPALDTRIRVSVSSCYFGVQEGRYEQDELSVPDDFRWLNRMTLFNDADLVALICPRALQVQAGSTDMASHREKGRELAPRAASYYERLGQGERFEHFVFDGGHEFDDASAWPFVERELKAIE
ncbi:MAG: acetylxylan esterase, partial [Planctomycetales bacterium]|nr:acetylxylan esterase [Planctomycetales bacterium]